MYYFLYGLFYLLSLLPWRVLYIISDGVYLLLYYAFGYRRKVVMHNLGIAFPEKTEQERINIAKKFYRNFTDTFIETIKLLSVSRKQFFKRVTINAEVVNDLYSTGKSVQLHIGHFFNWEVANLALSGGIKKYPFLGVYAPPKNEAMHRIIVKLRNKFGTILIPSTSFRTTFHQYAKEQYVIGLVADQNPGAPEAAFWTPFFGRMTPFVTGPERGAKSMNTAIVHVQFYKVKRGYYRIEMEHLTSDPRSMEQGEITRKFVTYLENCIRTRPDNYLWSHRRWKYEFNEEQFGKQVI